MMKKIIALICVCSVLFTTGCSSFVKGFMDGVNGALDSNSGSASTESDTAAVSGQSHSDSEVKTFIAQQAEAGVLKQRLIRFTGYEYKTGISMQQFSKRETLNNYLTDLLNSGEMLNNTYFLRAEKKMFQEGEFFVTKADATTASFLSLWFYIGEVNSDSQPDGYGMMGFYLDDEYLYDSTPTAVVTYIGEFKDGRKNGYGVQFYAPASHFYVPEVIMYLSKQKVEEKNGLSEYDEGYSEAVAQLYTGMMSAWGNFPIYEGEFKDNKFSGKGNYSCPYVSYADEFELTDVSENDMMIDVELIKRYVSDEDMLMMNNLYVGTFKDNKPNKAKYYSFGKLEHDGQWKDFAEPK